jgi:Flp pilus assembly protein TadD
MVIYFKYLARFTIILLLFFSLTACSEDSFDYSSGILNQAEPPNTELTPDSMMQIGRNLENRGEYRAALGFYTRTASENSGNLSAQLGIGRMLVQLGGSDEAMPIFESLYSQDSGQPGVSEGYAEVLVRNGEDARARAVIDLEIERGRVTSGIYSLNGLLYDLDGQRDKARAAYSDGLGVYPGSVGLIVNLALSFALTGELEAASGLLESLADDPVNARKVRQNLGLIQALSGDIDGAMEIVESDLTPGQNYQNRLFYSMLQFLEGRARTYAVYFGEIAPDTQSNQ